jgi:predicted DNA-binding transcriptional regulator YafY
LDKTFNKYIGSIIEIIYQSSDGNITQRKIEVRSVKENLVRAYCFTKKGTRVFRMENILAAVPIRKWSV